MRLFFAILIPSNCTNRVAEVQADLKERIGNQGIKWTETHQYHYTLKFLGEHGFQRAETAAEVASAVATEMSSFQMTLGGLGAFPNSERPSTIWLGATEGGSELALLATRLDDVLSRRGFQKDRKAAKAHLTIARVKSYEGESAAARALRANEQYSCGSFKVDRFYLMRSITRPTGSEYSVLKEFELKMRET